MPRKQTPSERHVALCYVRQSYTRDGDDKNSPERQRANIERVCQENGWTPEWYEDAEGHKSGRTVKNRPGWLALEKRLSDPDVVALVANDLARLHRKGWRVGDLIERLEKSGITLVLAAPNRAVDTSTPMGKIFVQFAAVFDEYYAEDISQRAKDSIQYRKKRGITIGRPPFGTVRGEDGYLHPSPEGAWLLPDGTFQAGRADAPPAEGAIWRGYHETAHRILATYAENSMGLEKIAYKLNDEGWPFCDRYGQPRPITRDDVRRVVANWPEYGGVVLDAKAKDRPAYEGDVDAVPLRPERAVFPVELLRQVGRVRHVRTLRPPDRSVKRKARPYALSGLVYCAHCDAQAEALGDPRLRTRLTGRTDANGIRRYKHKTGVTCGVHNRSIPCDELETDFGRLIQLLTVKAEALDLLTELAIQAEEGGGITEDEAEFERQRQKAIALCNRRIEAARMLYLDGDLSREEYLVRKERNEREIAHWQARTTETQQVALELGMCIEAVDRLARLWDAANDEDRKGMAQNLFEEIVVDVDARRIVGFKLKPWADRFLVLRMALYEDEYPDLAEEVRAELAEKENPLTDQGQGNPMPHRGIEPLFPP